MSAARHTNRLALETSPYLQQHQHNPVDWYAWGEKAFERSRAENKPIFLSVGYSTCYWCHVMERECFENEAIARVMNEHFVNIKVDREERPDVDQLYMTAVQVMSGQGGWPMSVWLTPDLKPFYGGTYFPPTDAHGRPGFPRLLAALADAYRNRHDEVEQSADEMVRVLRQVAQSPKAEPSLDAATIDKLVRQSADDYEPRFGGFGQAPKFPRQTLLKLLLTWLDLTPASDPNRATVAKRVRHTLAAMANGGIRDHLGGGFHRYSTDAKWLVPHFEIMLYDQAMLAPVYARAARILGEPRFATVARGICDFVLREMSGTHGEFFTALDAEVDHREGLNYLWTPAQVAEILGELDAERFGRVHGLEAGPNFADPHHSDGVPDQNILFLPDGPTDEADPAIVAMRLKLREARSQRKQPLLDTKVLTSWNAMMIEALAIVSRELNELRYRDAAVRCVDFLLRQHVKPDCRLIRTSRDGHSKHDGFLDDYAYLATALLELHTTTRDPRWRTQADVVTTTMKRLFGDADGGAFFFTAAGASDLLVRQKSGSDSPLPNGNAQAALALHAVGDGETARGILDAFAGQLRQHPESMSALLEMTMILERERRPGAACDVVPMPSIRTSPAVVSMQAHRASDRRIDVDVTIDPRYHLHDTNIDPKLGLHATRLRVDGAHAELVDFIDYPPTRLLTLPYGPPVAAYRGNVRMSVTFAGPMPAEPVSLSLSFQACDDSACLRPAIVSAMA
jgi:uncharacterized protein